VGTIGAVFACLVLVLALGACGTADRENDIAAVTKRFQAAIEARDGQAACDELSEETATALEQQEKKPCEDAILELDLPTGDTIAVTKVYARSAYAALAEGGTDFLDEGPDGWVISAAGCEPTAPEQPYDCELEG
jgi:hypothetical protein